MFVGADLRAQIKVLRVDPQQTDAAIVKVQDAHIALEDGSAAPAHRLLVFLAGTRATPESGLAVESAFARWGYHVIGLDYENGVLAVACAHSTDSACFDHYREAIVTGAPVSEKISVDRANSILNRLEKLLVYLAKTDPGGGWDEFAADGQPVWGRIVVAGHSQGSGHAAYIGKMFAVDRVLMFSGPQDYLDDLNEPAPWESSPSATLPSRFFAFLNVNDPFNVQHQIASCAVLMKLAQPAPLMVEPGAAIQGDHQILVNDVEAKRAHGSTIQPEFESVWQYMSTEGDAIRPALPAPPRPTPAR
jgi:hypothetical protein